jgi:hypothetical protein
LSNSSAEPIALGIVIRNCPVFVIWTVAILSLLLAIITPSINIYLNMYLNINKTCDSIGYLDEKSMRKRGNYI